MRARFAIFSVPLPVLFLGLTSLFTDLSSEIVYPLLPIFITSQLGAGAWFIGLVEGIAEATASLTKYWSGRFSDRLPRKDRITMSGYALSTFTRSAIALAFAPWHVLALRFGDRLGKGIRTAPRDAWLARLAPAGKRGQVFGFHRAMDHTGAIIGPLAAALFLYLYPGALRTLFALSVIPGIAALGFIVLAQRAEGLPAGEARNGDRKPRAARFQALSPVLRRFLSAVLLFSLANSSDSFLLLKLTSSGIPGWALPLLWAGLHVVRAASSLIGGPLSDRIGRRGAITCGWSWYAGIYLLLAISSAPLPTILAFLSYGLFSGLSEGPERALIADLAPAEQLGAVYGLYHLAIGIAALPASLLFGWIWSTLGMSSAFMTAAGLSLAATAVLWMPANSLHPRGSSAPTR